MERMALWIGGLVVTLLAIASVFPLYWMISGSFKLLTDTIKLPPEWLPANPTLENYTLLFTKTSALRWAFNSTFVAAMIALGSVITSTTAGYAFAKKRFFGSGLLFALIIATMMLPQQVLLIPLFVQISDLGWVNSYQALILPFVTYPMGVFLIRQFMQSVPDELIEAAKIDGAGEIRTFIQIVVPIVKPAVGAIAIFGFVNGWNEYLWQLVATNKEEMFTIPIGISRLAYGTDSTNLGLLMAGASIAFVPMLIIFISFQRYFISGITVGSVKG